MDLYVASSRVRYRKLRVIEDRCVCCGKWKARSDKRASVTCSDTCRKRLFRLRKAGRQPRFAKTD